MKLEHGDLVHVRDPQTSAIDLAQYHCWDCHFQSDDPHSEHSPRFVYMGTEFTSYPDEVEVVEKLAVVRL